MAGLLLSEKYGSFFQMQLLALMPVVLAIVEDFPSGSSMSDYTCCQQLKATLVIGHLSFALSTILPVFNFLCIISVCLLCPLGIFHFLKITKGWAFLSIPLQSSGWLCLGSRLPWRHQLGLMRDFFYLFGVIDNPCTLRWQFAPLQNTFELLFSH